MIRLLAALLFGALLALAGLELYHARYAEPAYCPVPAPSDHDLTIVPTSSLGPVRVGDAIRALARARCDEIPGCRQSSFWCFDDPSCGTKDERICCGQPYYNDVMDTEEWQEQERARFEYECRSMMRSASAP